MDFNQSELYKELYEFLELGTQDEFKDNYDHIEKILEALHYTDKVEHVFSFGDYEGGTVDRYWVFRYKDQLYRYDAVVNSWDDGNSSPWYQTCSLKPVKEYTRIENYYE